MFHKCCFTEMLNSLSRESIRAKSCVCNDKCLMLFYVVIQRLSWRLKDKAPLPCVNPSRYLGIENFSSRFWVPTGAPY